MNKSYKSNVVTKVPLQVAIRAIGNSKGVVIPKIILEQSGIQELVEMSVDGEKIILSKPKNTVRENWSQDAQSLAKSGEDKLVLGDFSNDEDGDWVWQEVLFLVEKFGLSIQTQQLGVKLKKHAHVSWCHLKS